MLGLTPIQPMHFLHLIAAREENYFVEDIFLFTGVLALLGGEMRCHAVYKRVGYLERGCAATACGF